MDGHPIESLMKTAMESIKEMIEVNTIVGDPVETVDGGVIIPVSKVSFGFAAGGSEFNVSRPKEDSAQSNSFHLVVEAVLGFLFNQLLLW